MNANYRGWVATVVLFLFLSLALSLPASAAVITAPQPGAPISPRDAALLRAFSPAEIQAVRDQLNAISADLTQIESMIGVPSNQSQAALIGAQQANLRDVDIARWLATGVDLAPLQRDIESAMAKTANATLRSQKGAVSPNTTAGFPTAQYGSACSGYTSDSDVVFGYQTALNTAKLVWIPLKDACDEVLVAVGEGGNTSLACIIPDEILQAAELILAQYTICDGDTQSAQVAANYDRLAYLNEQIDTDYNATISNSNGNAAAIQSNDNNNKNAIVSNDNSNAAATQANDNANKNAIVANDNANAAAILLALQQALGKLDKALMEANLSSSSPPVGTYELPLSSGGQLEPIRDLVTATIATMQADGQYVGTALTYLSQGNTYLAAHQYKLAFGRYRAAYQQAVN
jgi:hypothetical protein